MGQVLLDMVNMLTVHVVDLVSFEGGAKEISNL